MAGVDISISARDAYEAVVPLMVTSSFLNRVSDIWPVPDARWQSLQMALSHAKGFAAD
jgi:hypothetical protein